jgi:hypothetical protein
MRNQGKGIGPSYGAWRGGFNKDMGSRNGQIRHMGNKPRKDKSEKRLEKGARFFSWLLPWIHLKTIPFDAC